MSGPTAKHRDSAPTGLASVRIVLIAGAVVSAAAAMGGLWLVRAAVGVALVSAVLAAVLVIRQLRARRFEHRNRLRSLERDHAQRLGEERDRNAAVVQTLDDRLGALRTEVGELRRRIGQLQTELGERDDLVAALRAREVRLTRQLWHEGVLSDLAADPAIHVVDDRRVDADVHLLPRHGLSRIGAAGERDWGNLELPSERTGS